MKNTTNIYHNNIRPIFSDEIKVMKVNVQIIQHKLNSINKNFVKILTANFFNFRNAAIAS